MVENHLSSRILALDLLRGYFLCVIAVDHLYRFPSLLDALTGQGKLWVSAAEGFFLISGLLVGLLKQKPKKILSRAGKLYLWSISLTLFFTFWGSYFINQPIKTGLWTGPFPSLFISLISLKYVYGWADFLPYYVIYLLFSPLVLIYLHRGKTWLILLLSGFFWLIRENNSYLAWQILFFIGLVAGFHFNKLNLILEKFSTLILSSAVVSIVASAYFVFTLNTAFPIFDKNTLAPGRWILALLWFSAFFLVFRRYENIINIITGGGLKLLGVNSLFVYGLQSVVLFPAAAILPPTPDYLRNTIYNVSVLVVIYVVTLFRSRILRRPRPVKAEAYR